METPQDKYQDKAARYEQLRTTLKTGDVVAYSGRAIVGRLIRMATLSSFSHVGIILKMAGRVFVVEAKEGKGVVLTPLSKTGKFSVLRQPDGAIKHTASQLIEEVGDDYSYRNALRGWLGFTMTAGGRQCAEFVAHHKDINDLAHITPGELVLRLLDDGYTLHS